MLGDELVPYAHPGEDSPKVRYLRVALAALAALAARGDLKPETVRRAAARYGLDP
ncbi:hypothetical protein [Peterkaempfera bronchialis]|uniref:hypothetical protein n=1 Tax=Peterkaempfera bronchialis TaxID=2126346 RepID=UPI003C2FF1C9